MKTTYSEHTAPGKRSHNEDTHLSRPALALYLIADGMGGHYTGDRASLLARDTIEARVEGAAQAPRLELLEAAIQQANTAVYERSSTDHTCRGMGTTVAALAFEEDRAIIAHVGDSRVYRLRQGRLTQLTHDHSLINEYIKSHTLTPEQIEAFPHKNVITRALGMKADIEVSVITEQARAGDLYLLCSDGLTERLSHERLELLMQHDHDALAQSLVMAAIEADTSDNVTAIVVRCT